MNVGAVGFDGNAVLFGVTYLTDEYWDMKGKSYITARHNPVLDYNILGIPTIKAIGIDCVPLRGRSSVHIKIRHRNILRIRDEGMPD